MAGSFLGRLRGVAKAGDNMVAHPIHELGHSVQQYLQLLARQGGDPGNAPFLATRLASSENVRRATENFGDATETAPLNRIANGKGRPMDYFDLVALLGAPAGEGLPLIKGLEPLHDAAELAPEVMQGDPARAVLLARKLTTPEGREAIRAGGAARKGRFVDTETPFEAVPVNTAHPRIGGIVEKTVRNAVPTQHHNVPAPNLHSLLALLAPLLSITANTRRP